MSENTLLLLGVWLNGSLSIIMATLWAYERSLNNRR